MKKLLMLVSLVFLLVGCCDKNSISDLNSAASDYTNDPSLQLLISSTGNFSSSKQLIQQNESPKGYQWLYEEIKLRNDKINKIESDDGYIFERPGVVICVSDLDNNNEKEFFIGEWHISATVCEIEYTMFDHLGEKVLEDTFSLSIGSNNELFYNKVYTSTSGEKYILEINEKSSYTQVTKLYYSKGWKMDLSIYDNEENPFILPTDKFESLKIITVQIYSEKDITNFISDYLE